jgi:hypothetical protein
MSLSRREAMSAVVGCGLAATASGNEGQPPLAELRRDPVYVNMPNAIREVFEATFPNHRCVRMAMRQEKGAAVYRATVFDPTCSRASQREVGDETVSEPILYHLEVSADARVIEETAHPVLDRGRLPKAVVASYEKWNPKGVEGREHWWTTELPRGGTRVYRVLIILNAVEAYRAAFREDGTVVSTDPAVVP